MAGLAAAFAKGMALPGMEAPRQEWPGATSSKFTDKLHGGNSQKREVPSEVRDGADIGLARNGFAKYFGDARGLDRDSGKKSIRVPDSDVFAWRPSRRSLDHPGEGHLEKPEGLRVVAEPERKVYTMRERKHIRCHESKEEYGDLPRGNKIVFRDNGLRASDQPAREVDLIHEMSRKVRPLDLYSQRNGIQCRSMGDKPYRHPEYENGFHKAGNLVIGCGFHRGMHARTEARNSTSISLNIDMNKPPLKSYQEKQREKMLAEDADEVAELTRNWEKSTLLDCDEAGYVDIDSEDEAQPQAE